VVDSRAVELEGGASTNISLGIAPETTDALDPGPHTYTVVTSNDSAEGTLTVLEPATFLVSGLNPGTYTAGSDEVVAVSATVTNAGDVAGAKRVELRVDDGDSVTTVANATVDLEAGGSTSVTFDLDAGQFDGGEYTHSVWTEDDTATGTVRVNHTPVEYGSGILTGRVTNDDGESIVGTVYVSEIVDERHGLRYEIDPVDPMALETFTVTAVDVDTGTELQTITVSADELRRFEFRRFGADRFEASDGRFTLLAGDADSRVTLRPVPAFEEPQVSITINAVQRVTGKTGSSASTAVVADRVRSSNVVIPGAEPVEGAIFSVSNLEPENHTAAPGEVVDVSATVTNVGDAAATKRVELRVDDGGSVTTVANATVDLEAGGSTSVTFDLDASQFETGTYTHSVWTKDDVETGTLRVEAQGHWWDQYVNESDVVLARGLNEAVREYLSDELSAPRLNAVIESYLTGEPMPVD
jgi:hypothetical protein